MSVKIVVQPMGHGGNITQEGIVQSMPHGWEALYNPWGMGNSSPRKALYNPCPMGGNNVVQPMGHGIVQPLYGPWVMGPRHIVWPMTHGKKVAERARWFPGGPTSKLGVIGVDTGIDDVHVTTLATSRMILVESETSEAKPLTVEMRARHWETASLSITRQE
jgi:hypothetical protein